MRWCRNHNPLKNRPWNTTEDFIAHIKQVTQQWADDSNFVSVVFVGTKEPFNVFTDMCVLVFPTRRCR